MDTEVPAPILFKKKTRRNIRQRESSPSHDTETETLQRSNKDVRPTLEDESAEDIEVTQKIEMLKELKRLRQRPHGISAVALALGKKVAKEEEVLLTDPFKSLTGGMIDMEALKSGKYKQEDDAYDTGIGTQFSAETNTRDEDAEMLKYIDIQLNERKKATQQETEQVEESPKFLSPEEAALMALPEYLRKSGTHKNEEMLSNQMLSGIPEIDLGIEVKIRNIEATEEAKQKILKDRMSKKELPSQFVPTNMAVNFVQHNRFNIEEPNSSKNAPKRKVEPEKPKKKVVVVGSEPEELEMAQKKEKGDKATDDFHFEKFKKQFRRF